MSTDVLILRRRDVADLLSLDDCISAVREAFRRHATDAPAPAVLGLHVEGGGFHVKAAALALDRFYFAAKVNGNFPGNAARGGLPTIQGVVVLADAERGSPLAIMDSIEITIQRTAAATAVAAEVLARRNAATAAIVGCGLQGRVQLRALTRVRAIGRAFAIDSDVTAAQRFAKEMSESLGIPIDASHDIPAALAESDICVTCTPSKRAIIMQPDVRPGTFV